MLWRQRASVVVVVAIVAGASGAAGQGTATVSGTLVDSATRQPIAGGIITLRSADRVFAERADESGAFRFSRVPTGPVVAEVKRIGYVLKSFAFDLGIDTTLRVVVVPSARKLVPITVLGKGEGVFGVIGRSADLSPISGAKVLVVGSGMTVTTDSAGQFFIPLKRPGSYMVRVTAEGFGEEVIPLSVKQHEVVESSQLLDVSDRPPLSAGLWDDFDQRLRWRPISSALVSGAELRARGGHISTALMASSEVVQRQLRPGPICLFVNGQPRPGMQLDDIRPEDVRAIEVYGNQAKDSIYLGPMIHMWPKTIRCGPSRRGGPVLMKWVVVWLR